MEGKDTYDNQRFYRGGRSGRGGGRGWRDEVQHAETQFQGRWDDRRTNFQDGRHTNQQWRQRESGSDLNQNPNREQQQFDLSRISLIGGLRKNCRKIQEKRYLTKTTLSMRVRWGEWLKKAKIILAYARDVARLDTNQKPAISQFNVQDAKKKAMWPEFVLRSCPGSV
jgi:hypothetical protein